MFADGNKRRIRCVNYDGADVSTLPFTSSSVIQHLAYSDSNLYITDGTRYCLISDKVQQYVFPNVLLDVSRYLFEHEVKSANDRDNLIKCIIILGQIRRYLRSCQLLR